MKNLNLRNISLLKMIVENDDKLAEIFCMLINFIFLAKQVKFIHSALEMLDEDLKRYAV